MKPSRKLLDLLRKHETLVIERTIGQGLEVVVARIHSGGQVQVATTLPDNRGVDLDKLLDELRSAGEGA